MILDASLLNTQHYKVWIKGKVEQSRERSNTLPPHLSVVAIKKAANGCQLYIFHILSSMPKKKFMVN